MGCDQWFQNGFGNDFVMNELGMSCRALIEPPLAFELPFFFSKVLFDRGENKEKRKEILNLS